MPRDYFHATYSAGSLCKCDSLIDKSLRLIIKDYYHATYSAGSLCKCNSLIDESLVILLL